MQRTLAKVGEIQDIANEAQANLDAQNVQILRINDQLTRMEGTLGRTKKLVAGFNKSLFADKVAITLIIAIVLTGGALVYSFTLESKS